LTYLPKLMNLDRSADAGKGRGDSLMVMPEMSVTNKEVMVDCTYGDKYVMRKTRRSCDAPSQLKRLGLSIKVTDLVKMLDISWFWKKSTYLVSLLSPQPIKGSGNNTCLMKKQFNWFTDSTAKEILGLFVSIRES
jgi:hypothetical protein